MVLTDEGHLLTNSHVVGDADSGTAGFADGTLARFDVVGRDPLSDLALVRVPAAAEEARADAVREPVPVDGQDPAPVSAG